MRIIKLLMRAERLQPPFVLDTRLGDVGEGRPTFNNIYNIRLNCGEKPHLEGIELILFPRNFFVKI
jgi:hypothetical protein